MVLSCKVETEQQKNNRLGNIRLFCVKMCGKHALREPHCHMEQLVWNVWVSHSLNLLQDQVTSWLGFGGVECWHR